MAVPVPLLLLLVVWVSFPSSPARFAAASGLCPRRDFAFLDAAVGSQCPLWIGSSLPLKVSGETMDKLLSHGQRDAYYSVLFYASWCPFSRTTQSTFDALSMMFPQMKHLAVEESSAVPSLFSRYGIHSFPSIFVVNGSRGVRYHGSKDLSSLVLFYKRITGLDPVAEFSVDQSTELANEDSIWLQHRAPREILRREPYLVFSWLFLFVKAFLYFFPEILSGLKAVWFSYVWHVNWGIFGEWSQILERALHVIDVKRLWSKLRLSNKTRNFQKGANNARAWASTFTSVSLGECSARSVPSD